MNHKQFELEIIESKENVCYFPGSTLFELYATHGLPLSISIDTIINKHKYIIMWDKFIEQARKNDWWDFKTIEYIENGLIDACIDKSYRNGVIERCKLYIMKNKHPNMS